MRPQTSELVRVFVQRDGMTVQEALDHVAEMRQRIAEGEDPEEVLYNEGLEPDYIFDLI